jgi:hypothetical protein
MRFGPLNGSGSGGDGEDLSALVIAACGTNPVRHIGRRALRAGAQLRQAHYTVISPAHALSASRRFAFGNSHKIFRFRLLKFQFV